MAELAVAGGVGGGEGEVGGGGGEAGGGTGGGSSGEGRGGGGEMVASSKPLRVSDAWSRRQRA